MLIMKDFGSLPLYKGNLGNNLLSLQDPGAVLLNFICVGTGRYLKSPYKPEHPMAYKNFELDI